MRGCFFSGNSPVFYLLIYSVSHYTEAMADDKWGLISPRIKNRVWFLCGPIVAV